MKVSKMKKVSVLLASLFVLGGCSSLTETSSSSGNGDDTALHLGSQWSLSGATAQYGISQDNAVKLAVEQKNADGGVLGEDVAYTSADNKSDNQEASTQATRLVENEGVNILIGSDTTGNTEAQIPVAEQAQVPMITGSSTGDGLTEDNSGNVYDYVYRVSFQDSYQGGALAEFSNQQNYETAAILKDNSSDYGQNLATTFKDTFNGEAVTDESYVSGETDFQAVLTNLKEKQPDVIFIAGYYAEGGAIIKQAREMGIESTIVAPDGFGNQELFDLAGEGNLENIYYVSHFNLNEDSPENVKKFAEAYKEKYGQEPDHFSALAYDAAMLAMEAVEEAGTTDSEAVTKALADTQDFEGVTGTLTLDDKHNAVKPVYINEVQDGEVVNTTTVENQ